MIHKYTSKDISTCLHERKISIFGDSSARQIFWSLVAKLNGTTWESSTKVHENFAFNHAGVAVNFYWDPYFNSSILYELLWTTRIDGLLPQNNGIILLSGGLWHAKYLPEAKAYEQYANFVDNVTAIARNLPKKKVPPVPKIYVAPVPTPFYEKSLIELTKTIRPSIVRKFYERFEGIPRTDGLALLKSFPLLPAGDERAYHNDGIHVVKEVADWQADILLNLRCNSYFTGERKAPLDRTCCSAYKSHNWFVDVLLVFSLAQVLRMIGIPG